MADVETRLRRELGERAQDLRPAAGLPAALGTAVAKRRRRDRLVLGAAVVALLALVATGVVLRLAGDESSTPVVTGPDGGAGEWVPMSESPLSPRTKALAFTIGDEAFIFGGHGGCATTARCAVETKSDAAAFDPATNRWRRVTGLPDDPATGRPYELRLSSGVTLADRLYLWGRYPCGPLADCSGLAMNVFLAYDAGDDTWTRLPLPTQAGLPADLQAGDVPPQLTTDGRRVIASLRDSSAGRQDVGARRFATALAYEPPSPACSGSPIAVGCRSPWSELPVDPLRPSTSRTLVGHDGDLYLFATPLTGGTQASVLRADANEWIALPDPPSPLEVGAYVVGDQIVSPSPGPTSGVPPEVLVTAAPAAVFDTSSAQWLDPPPLPFDAMPRPEPALDRLGVVAGPRLIAVGGLVLDLDAAWWSALPAPTTLTDEGQAATWVDDTLVVWGGQSAAGEGSAAGATWTPAG